MSSAELEWSEAEGSLFHISLLCHTRFPSSTLASLCAQAPFGGPLATLTLNNFGEGALQIFTSDGQLLSNRAWIQGKVRTMGWMKGLRLVLVLESGEGVVVVTESMSKTGGYLRSIPNGMIPACRVACAQVWDGGCVIVSEMLQVVELIHDRLTVRVTLSPSLLMSDLAPRFITVLRPSVASSEPSQATFIAALPEQSGIVVIEPGGNVRAQYASAGVARSIALAPHPSYKLVASIGSDGILSILPQDFCQVISKHDCGDAILPDALMWCGYSTFALCVCYESRIVVVPLEHKFPQLSRAHLAGSVPESENLQVSTPQDIITFQHATGILSMEVDGIRIMTADNVFMLRQVPECWRSIFRLGSTEAGAMLLDAVEMLDHGDAGGDENLKEIASLGQIRHGVESLLDAAEHATTIQELQVVLLRVASYGKRFFRCDGYKERRELSQRLVNTCRLVRLCKQVLRKAGMALTIRQLKVLTPQVLIDRLLFQGRFALASQLCSDARVPMPHVVTQWAMKLAFNDMDDERLKVVLLGKVEELRSMNYTIPVAPMAAACLAAGRKEATLALAAHETCLARRVLLMLTAGFEEKAINVVINENGADPDLAIFVAFRVHEQLPWQKLVALAKGSTKVFDLFARYLESNDHAQYKKLLFDTDNKKAKGMILAEESCMSMHGNERVALMKEASVEFRDAGLKTMAALSADHARLLDRQNSLGDSVVGLSLANTVLDCFRRGLDDEAIGFAREFGLKDSIFRRIQLRGLAARKAWTRVQDLSCQQAVLSVLDLADFAEVCIASGNVDEATKYLHQLSDSHPRKAYLLIQIRNWDAALESAFNIGDTGAMETIRRHRPAMADEIKSKMKLLDDHGPNIKPKKSAAESGAQRAIDAANKAAQGCAQQ